ncbi:alpha-L-fucosidase [Paenibacillus sp. IB182496]|uniref:alpha-L-fucosidase n=1 Tax=Paenibacillus sabuli TaxID=2772509 RepID=A0A927BXQ4_9BACL|nr:alpha-L-fucosidase [Paenibacillus sabuli]MBD2847414.1 alpha-L-fucosidase [Paenibacillus sabuli]
MMKRFGDERDWFFERRIGMFVHWGLYAINGWHEQEMWRRHVPRAHYVKLAERFNPERFDPDQWIDLAESAGMRYMCVTAKHHDGFCLWDTRETAFHVMNTPYGKDIIGMLAEACARRGMPLQLYYSCVDWHHPNYPNQGRHHELSGPQEGDRPDMAAYMAFVRNQLRELCTNYGTLHGIFWDMNVPGHRDPGLHAMIRHLQPAAVINDRGYGEGDYGTPERDYDAAQIAGHRAFDRPTEACQSLGMTSWGYRSEEDYYSAKYMMQSMDQILAMGGNYLLNVGPCADGTIAPEYAAAFGRIGQWSAKARESWEGAEPASELLRSPNMLLTRKGTSLYVHLYRDPQGAAIVVEGLETLPIRAVLLNDGRELPCVRSQGTRHWRQPLEDVRIRGLPIDELAGEVPVIRLEFDHAPALRPQESGEPAPEGLFR